MENSQPGALALVGSGEYLPKAQALETELLRLGISRGKTNTYIQIPTAAGKEGDDRLDFWRLASRMTSTRLEALSSSVTAKGRM